MGDLNDKTTRITYLKNNIRLTEMMSIYHLIIQTVSNNKPQMSTIGAQLNGRKLNAFVK